MYYLIIKGSSEDAEKALLRHNLQSSTIRPSASGKDTLAYVTIEESDLTLHNWFNEDLGREVFLPGSLLFFNVVEGSGNLKTGILFLPA